MTSPHTRFSFKLVTQPFYDGYGTESETLISSASAVMLKKRNLAVTGWSREMYPTRSGHALAARKSNTP